MLAQEGTLESFTSAGGAETGLRTYSEPDDYRDEGQQLSLWGVATGLARLPRTKGRGSLIPHLPDVGGKGVRTSCKLGHGRLSETI